MAYVYCNRYIINTLLNTEFSESWVMFVFFRPAHYRLCMAVPASVCRVRTLSTWRCSLTMRWCCLVSVTSYAGQNEVPSLMPSAHGPIFCRNELRKKVSEDPIFYWSEVAHMDIPYDILFYKVSFGAHGPIFYRSYCVWQWQARSHCWITSLWFFIGLKSAHAEQFFVISSSEKKSDRFFMGLKVSAHKLIFTLIFCLCALGINYIIIKWPQLTAFKVYLF